MLFLEMDRIYTALDRIIKYPESLALQKLYDMRYIFHQGWVIENFITNYLKNFDRNLQSGGQNRPEDHKKTTVFSEPGKLCTYVPFSRPNRRTNLHQILHRPPHQLREGP